LLIAADLLGLEAVGRVAGATVTVLAGLQACGLLGCSSSNALADTVFPFIARSETLQEEHHWHMAAARWLPLLINPIQVEFSLAPGP